MCPDTFHLAKLYLYAETGKKNNIEKPNSDAPRHVSFCQAFSFRKEKAEKAVDSGGIE